MSDIEVEVVEVDNEIVESKNCNVNNLKEYTPFRRISDNIMEVDKFWWNHELSSRQREEINPTLPAYKTWLQRLIWLSIIFNTLYLHLDGWTSLTSNPWGLILIVLIFLFALIGILYLVDYYYLGGKATIFFMSVKPDSNFYWRFFCTYNYDFYFSALRQYLPSGVACHEFGPSDRRILAKLGKLINYTGRDELSMEDCNDLSSELVSSLTCIAEANKEDGVFVRLSTTSGKNDRALRPCYSAKEIISHLL